MQIGRAAGIALTAVAVVSLSVLTAGTVIVIQTEINATLAIVSFVVA
jgi:hypothetical protein